MASSRDTDWIVFRLDGQRYGVPVANVRDIGRLDGASWLQRRVQGRYGAYRLRDLKTKLRLGGEAGGLFIALTSATSGSVTAWAVDGIEAKRFDLAGTVWSASRDAEGPVLGTARALSSHPSFAELEGEQSAIPRAFPITLLDPSRF
jgi:hypothetical protein